MSKHNYTALVLQIGFCRQLIEFQGHVSNVIFSKILEIKGQSPTQMSSLLATGKWPILLSKTKIYAQESRMLPFYHNGSHQKSGMTLVR